MAYLDLPFVLIKSPEMLQLLQAIQLSVNIMTEENFPNPLSGDALLEDFSTPMRKLNVREWFIPLYLGAPATTIASINCGGFFNFNPAVYAGGSWFFEAAIQAPAGGTATARLTGAATIASVQSTSTSVTLVRTLAAIVMPTTPTILNVWLDSVGGSSTLWSARLMYVP